MVSQHSQRRNSRYLTGSIRVINDGDIRSIDRLYSAEAGSKGTPTSRMVAAGQDRAGHQLHGSRIYDLGSILATVASSGQEPSLRLQLGKCFLRGFHELGLLVLSAWRSEQL